MVTATLEDATTAQYRLDSVDTGAIPGISLYVLSFWDGSAWTPACGTDATGAYAAAGAPIPAVALKDIWSLGTGSSQADPNRFTFSCVNAALGSCLIWGYRRWARQTECLSPSDRSVCNEQDLSYAHQACTRLARADYCGDGRPHTKSGTRVEAYDSFGLRPRAGTPGFGLEAEWRSDGGHCIHFTRFTKADPAQTPQYATDADYIAAICPGRLAGADPSCADPAASHFFTQNGFSDPLPLRSILRSETLMP